MLLGRRDFLLLFFPNTRSTFVKQLYYSKQVMHGIHKTAPRSGKVVSGACSFLIHYGAVEKNLTVLFALKIQQSEAEKQPC